MKAGAEAEVVPALGTIRRALRRALEVHDLLRVRVGLRARIGVGPDPLSLSLSLPLPLALSGGLLRCITFGLSSGTAQTRAATPRRKFISSTVGNRLGGAPEGRA